MNKQGISFIIIGLVIGFIGGFFLANKINRDAGIALPNQQTVTNSPVLPNNPQVQSAEIKDAPKGAMIPDIAEKLDKATKEPDNFDAQIAAGEMYARIKKFDKAIEFFEKANKIKPDDYKTIVKIGNANFDFNKYEVAEKWYESALKINPDDVNVRTDLGLTFYLREPKDIERAIKEYQTSLSKDPNHELTLQNLAAAQSVKGDKQGLQETLSKLEKVNPNNPVFQKSNQELPATN
jgi:tetratricopeptide (TPR) repeat protein